tara:strand:- start:129 stop:338 length:210 start_codon:yes stop_codon:yes gene_type:complete
MKLLKEIEEAMIWAFSNNKLELLGVLQEFFEQADEDYEADSESESDYESDMDNEDLTVKVDKEGFLSLA